jgi:N-acetylmuramic acid 6-phosphate etherase
MESPEILLGIECGGTRTVALAVGPGSRVKRRLELGPCNLRLVDDARLEAHFRNVSGQVPQPSAIGIGMAGVRDARDCNRVQRVLNRVWPGIPAKIDHDLESAISTPAVDLGAPSETRVVILSGTGSCCFGRTPEGKTVKVGGWGHLLGDRGSAYDIAFRALRAAAHELDHTGVQGRLGKRMIRKLDLKEPNDLIAWMANAGKGDVAALAPLVFEVAAGGDRTASRVVSETVEILAADALACARRLRPRKGPLRFLLAGSVLLKQPVLVRRLRHQIRQALGRVTVEPLDRDSVWGAVVMARFALQQPCGTMDQSKPSSRKAPSLHLPPVSKQVSPTELRNPRSMHLDRLGITAAIDLMLNEDALIADSIRPHSKELGRLIRDTALALRRGGRLLYVGAGTSGRLGVLDASECPPTFSSAPEQVQGIMAGGLSALHSSIEGAEDHPDQGASAVADRKVGPLDVVLGIAASGRTPFVWGALTEARTRGATTALLCFNPHLEFKTAWRPRHVLAIDVGPEVLTGSTRLKAGTATKLVLNMLTTLVMVQLGKVIGNLMVDLRPSNEKLRDRACRIVGELTSLDLASARLELERSGWRVAEVVRRFRSGKGSRSGSRSVARGSPRRRRR